MGASLQMADLPSLIDTALRMVAERLERSNGAGIYQSIAAQLAYVKHIVDTGQQPADEQLDRLLLGVYAAREFETADPAFAEVLFDVEYLFKRLAPAVRSPERASDPADR